MKKKNILITLFALILLLSVVAVTYAYYIGSTNNDKAQTANLSTGTMSLTFADNDNGFGGQMEFGQTITKKFTIQNTGTLDASANMNWFNIVNNYLEGSLKYTLEYSETLNGTYTTIISNENVPRSVSENTIRLAPEITVPVGKTYYYNLNITLVDSETVDQTADLGASFWTQFSLSGIEKTPSDKTAETLGIIAKLGDPDFYSTSPGIKGVSDNFSGKAKTRDMTSYQDVYIAYSDIISFNSKNGKYSLVNPKFEKWSEVYNSLAGKYMIRPVPSYTSLDKEGLYETFNKKNTDIYKISFASQNSLNYIVPTFTYEYSDDYSDDGVYLAKDDYGISYYFRGKIENNYFKFGKWAVDLYVGQVQDGQSNTWHRNYFSLIDCQNANATNCTKIHSAGSDMYFRIVRINGDGSIKLIYDGTQAWTFTDYTQGNPDRVAGYGVWDENVSATTNASVGYMYGNADGETYDAVHSNTNDSLIKKYLDKWYVANFAGTKYETYISDEIFCNDRSIISGTGIGVISTFYGASDRVNDSRPSLICPQKHDAFTVNDTVHGNGDLTYPIGLITADELLIAGINKDSYSNMENYLYKEDISFFTMSPVYHAGNISRIYALVNDSLSTYNEYGFGIGEAIIPVINIGAEHVKNIIGDGSATNPYRFE